MQMAAIRRCVVAAILGLPLWAAARLPPEIFTALDRAKVPAEAMVVVVQEVGSARARLSWQPDLPVNPASLTKLLTTYAALELLGPAWAWNTPVWLNGSVRDGVLEGDLVIKGTGDPKLVVERLWLLLRRVQQLGVQEIRGDIVLDRSAFNVPPQHPGDFDNEPLRPYNVRADALMLNYRALSLAFVPDREPALARVLAEPPLGGVAIDATVPLHDGPCGDWRGILQADFSDPARVAFRGSYAAACADRHWSVAYPDPKSYDERLLAGLWQQLGGKLGGVVREGVAPATRPSFESASPALSEVIREINKYSNNVMAQQLFLTLGLARGGVGSPDTAREALRTWMTERLGKPPFGTWIDNGSGLSRDTRLTAGLLARLLQSAWAGPVMSELMASLPVSGLDGTMLRSRAVVGRAHLKTGSLRDVAAIAGYVLAPSGRRLVVVGIINHPNANAARPALEALVQWAAGEGWTSSPTTAP